MTGLASTLLLPSIGLPLRPPRSTRLALGAEPSSEEFSPAACAVSEGFAFLLTPDTASSPVCSSGTRLHLISALQRNAYKAQITKTHTYRSFAEAVSVREAVIVAFAVAEMVCRTGAAFPFSFNFPPTTVPYAEFDIAENVEGKGTSSALVYAHNRQGEYCTPVNWEKFGISCIPW